MDVSAYVKFNSSLPLEEVAAVISHAMCADIPFGGLNEYVRDEMPAVYASKTIFGLFCIVYGEDGEYCLELGPEGDFHLSPKAASYVYISEFIAEVLRTVGGIYNVEAL